MKAEACPDRPTDFAGAKFQRRCHEIGGHSSGGKIVEIAAAQFRGFVFRILRRQRGEIFAASQLNRKRFDRGVFRLNNLGRSLRRRGQKQMTHAKPLGHEEIFQMRTVKAPTFTLGNIEFG